MDLESAMANVTHPSSTRSGGASFVVNLMAKKTPGAKLGTNVSSYRTIEEARVRGSGDQPDAPRQTHAKMMI